MSFMLSFVMLVMFVLLLIMIVAWIVSMTIIVACYAGILVSVRKSFIEFVARTREERIRRKV